MRRHAQPRRTPVRSLSTAAVGTLLMASSVLAQSPRALGTSEPRVLFLSKSSGFEHSSIKRTDDQPAHVERVLAAIAERRGFSLDSTKDAGRINAAELPRYRAVVFYTTGDLTERGGDKPGIFAGDGQPPMGPHGLDELLAWIRNGGGFLGFHCATDTFHSSDDAASAYVSMLGGEFRQHGAQFEGTVRVVDPGHPAMTGWPAERRLRDEWYLFKNLATADLHVLALMDPGTERANQQIYDIAPYPVIWTRAFGDGRVYYNAMGHREDVWSDPQFQELVGNAVSWAMGEGESDSEPNYRSAVGASTSGHAPDRR